MTERGPGRLVAVGAIALAVGATVVCAGAGAAPSPASFSSVSTGAAAARSRSVARWPTPAVPCAPASRERPAERVGDPHGREGAHHPHLTAAVRPRERHVACGLRDARIREASRSRHRCRACGVQSTVPHGDVDVPRHGGAAAACPCFARCRGAARRRRAARLLFEVTPEVARSRTSSSATTGTSASAATASASRASTGVDSTYAGPFAIGEDKAFTVRAGPATISGRLGDRSAEGTIAVAYTLPADANGRTSACSATIAWTATSPPPPPKRALVGTYCGFAAEGEGAAPTSPRAVGPYATSASESTSRAATRCSPSASSTTRHCRC